MKMLCIVNKFQIPTCNLLENQGTFCCFLCNAELMPAAQAEVYDCFR